MRRSSMRKYIILVAIVTSLFININSEGAFAAKKIAAKSASMSIMKKENSSLIGQVRQSRDKKVGTTRTYTVQAGDSLSSIAKKFATTVARLLELNPSIQNANRLLIGQVIIVPVPNASFVAEKPVGFSSQKMQTYTVRSGDTLSGIAKKFGVTTERLLSFNPNIRNPNMLQAGQVLNIAPVNMNREKKAEAIIETGKKYLGAKYVLGAPISRTDIFDCSSFTYRVYQENGIFLPRTSREQASVGKEIPLNAISKGDLIFFDTDYDGVINHVSIVVDKRTILHAATSTGVAFASTTPYWSARAVKAVRVF